MYDRSNDNDKGGINMVEQNFASLHSIEAVDQFISKNDLAFLYITMPNCSVCHGLLPQIEAMFEQYPNIVTRTIDASEVQEIAGRLQIFTAPVLILFVEGKEYLREARFVQTAKLDEQIAKVYENMVD